MKLQKIDKTDQESLDLALHVDLCALRYAGIIDKLDVMDEKLTDAAMALIELKEKMVTNNRDAIYLRWAGVIITALLGGLIHLLTK
jgi:hypothetical protein